MGVGALGQVKPSQVKKPQCDRLNRRYKSDDGTKVGVGALTLASFKELVKWPEAKSSAPVKPTGRPYNALVQ
jgi:hypothetical protein